MPTAKKGSAICSRIIALDLYLRGDHRSRELNLPKSLLDEVDTDTTIDIKVAKMSMNNREKWLYIINFRLSVDLSDG